MTPDVVIVRKHTVYGIAHQREVADGRNHCVVDTERDMPVHEPESLFPLPQDLKLRSRTKFLP